MLFVDSADKAARFIWLCDAFGIPLLFLADVPGFMIGKKVEREGIIRAGAKMIMAVSEATVPRISVVVRKAYGAGLYAMCGPGFEPDACLALPRAMIAVMGPEAAVNAVYYNKIQALAGGRARAPRRRSCARSTARTSTSSGSRASWWSTPWCRPSRCATRSRRACAAAARPPRPRRPRSGAASPGVVRSVKRPGAPVLTLVTSLVFSRHGDDLKDHGRGSRGLDLASAPGVGRRSHRDDPPGPRAGRGRARLRRPEGIAREGPPPSRSRTPARGQVR